ncbi:MAG: MoaD/ThiS family protein [Firmicutes bacterium]|nr:MoaD/ThiS family protein [Bacillota bacterium]MBU4533476.1 MoaD/ThiS family protein [Bacillota bacterium]MBU4554848.1 MoaD/ThiS family protein [Bacillota bacterium]
MRISIRLFATLQRYLRPPAPGEGTALEVPEGTTVDGLLRTLGVPLEQVKIVMVNGIHAEMEYVLREADRVGVFPPVAGG